MPTNVTPTKLAEVVKLCLSAKSKTHVALAVAAVQNLGTADKLRVAALMVDVQAYELAKYLGGRAIDEL